MPDVDVLAVVAASVATFITSSVYYGVLGERLAEVSPAARAEQPPPWQLVVVELGRASILTVVVAALAARGDIDDWSGGLLLGLGLWIGFPFVLWTGSVFHERTPRQLAAIHAGDWLLKLIVVGVIVAAVQ